MPHPALLQSSISSTTAATALALGLRSPEIQYFAARSPASARAARCAAVLRGHSTRATLPNFREPVRAPQGIFVPRLSLAPEADTVDDSPMTQPPTRNATTRTILRNYRLLPLRRLATGGNNHEIYRRLDRSRRTGNLHHRARVRRNHRNQLHQVLDVFGTPVRREYRTSGASASDMAARCLAREQGAVYASHGDADAGAAWRDRRENGEALRSFGGPIRYILEITSGDQAARPFFKPRYRVPVWPHKPPPDA